MCCLTHVITDVYPFVHLGVAFLSVSFLSVGKAPAPLTGNCVLPVWQGRGGVGLAGLSII